MALLEQSWVEAADVRALESEDDIFVLTPYKRAITLIRKHGGMLVQATHDGTDEKGDIEMLKMLCLYRYSVNDGNTY